MTRKRLIRLLMSTVYTRNEALEQAGLCRELGLAYEEAYRRIYTPAEPDPHGEAVLRKLEERYESGSSAELF